MIVNGVDIMESTINYRGIRTNNLKGIDLDIKKGTIIGIAGPSGSGKSSLAYGTIYAISQNEWGKVSDIPTANFQDYRLDSYKNVIPAIAMRQDNFNSNPTLLLLHSYVWIEPSDCFILQRQNSHLLYFHLITHKVPALIATGWAMCR